MGSLCVGIISSNSVKNANLVFEELLGSNFRRSFAFLAVSALGTVLFVGQLDARISYGRSSQMVQSRAGIPVRFGQNKGVSHEDSTVSGIVESQFEAGNFTGTVRRDPVVNQLGDTGRKAGGKTSTGHKGNVDILAGQAR